MAKIHELKTWDSFMHEIATGEKSFEIRKNDRGFKLGDLLYLKGWDQTKKEFTGKLVEVEVTYLLTGGNWGLDEDYVVMAIKVLSYNF